MAKRLPASGQFFYLPWQADIEKEPVLGIRLDACADISKAMPKVLKLDQWRVFGLYSWDRYGQCIQQLADTHYVKIKDKPFYVRKDLASEGL